MKHYLLPQTGVFYKANLHCHSTMSDGKLTPQQLRDAYREQGYSVLSITDHEYLLDHSDLNLPDFLMLTGYELYVKSSNGNRAENRFMPMVHMNLIAREPHNVSMVCADPAYMLYACKYTDVTQLPRVGELVHRHYNPYWINRITRAAQENGFMVFYNHPSWNLEDPSTYLQYENLTGVEIYNNNNANTGFPRDDTAAYDHFLRAGRCLIATANDDNHNLRPLDDPTNDSFGGWNMIKAEKLDYASIVSALEAGHCYASCGPEIKELYAEDNRVHIVCSDAREVCLVTVGRSSVKGRLPRICARKGEVLNEVSFEILPEDEYFRLEVQDHQGYKAYTNAYSVQEVLNLAGTEGQHEEK